MEDKILNNTNVEEAKKSTSDIEVFGDGDAWKLITKASSKSQGWMKSTKAMKIGNLGGVLVQVTTQQKNPDGSYSIAEAITHVPDAYIHEIYETNGGSEPILIERVILKR